MPQEYSVTFVNNSNDNWDFCLYQQDPDLIENPGTMTLAWVVNTVDAGNQDTVTWDLTYCFVWSLTGLEANGQTVFTASDTVPADLSLSNEIDFTYDGAFNFTNQTQDADADGSAIINQDGTIPLGQAYVGIGMAGSATFALPAEPNLPLTFTPDPEYWCTFGVYDDGQEMDTDALNNPKQLDFGGFFNATVTLGTNNILTVTYS